MNTLRAIATGTLIWLMIFIGYFLMSLIPGLKESEFQQFIVSYIFVIPFVLLGLKFYYKKGIATNKTLLGLVFVATALILDTMITVPFVIIPHGGSYLSFFGNIMFWVLPIEIIATTIFYKRNETTQTA